MVGTGIFTTSGFIMKELGNPLTMLICWFVGGLFALSGALCYGELGARYPRAGGEYAYLSASFGKCMGFLSGWVSLIVGFSAPIAAAAMAFSSYFLQGLGLDAHAAFTRSLVRFKFIDLSLQSLLAVLVVIGFSMLHYNGLRLGSKVQNVLTLLKISFILIFIVGGLGSTSGSVSHFHAGFHVGDLFQSRFAVALIFVSFAYSGWNAAAYLGGEIQNPQKNIPIALVGGTFFVMGLYLLLNAVYIYALSPAEMSGAIDVSARAAERLFGDRLGRVISALIALGLMSVISAMIMTGPRVYYAMSKDGVFFECFGKVSRAHRTPAHSIGLQAAIAIVIIVTSTFDMLLIYIGFTLSLFAMLTVVGLVVVRGRETASDIPYKTVAWPIPALGFVSGNAWILYFSLKSRFIPSMLGFFTICCGVLIYFYFERKNRREENGRQKKVLISS
jgi:APA family basic amino acid/polyamine antiporter